MPYIPWKKRLAADLHDLLEIPLAARKRSSGKNYYHPEKGHQIINAVFQAIAQALQRGEAVHVYGLGRFEVVERPPRRRGHQIVHSKGFSRPVFGGSKIYRGRKQVIFTPSPALEALVNMNLGGELSSRSRDLVVKRNWLQDPSTGTDHAN